MNWLDRGIGYFAPQRAARRLEARLQIRAYDAALSGPRRQGFGGRSTSANVEIGGGLRPLRDRARAMVRNTGHGHAIVDVMVRHVVGTGMTPVWETGSDALDGRVAALWEAWTRRADVEGELGYGALQQLAARSMVEGGETIARLVDLRRGEDREIPFRVQLLEGDHIDSTRDGLAIAGRGRARLGIGLGEWGRRTGAWLFENHPGDVFASISHFVPRDQFLHLYRPLRIGQLRGVTWLAPVLLPAKDLADLLQNTIVKSGIEAAFSAFIIDGPGGTTPLAGTVNQETGEREFLPEPGMMLRLRNGQDVKFAEPKTSTQFEPVAINTLQAMAVGAGLTYDQVTGDLRRANYSSLRAGKIEFRRLVEQVQDQLFIPRFCEPIAERFIDRAILAGSLPAGPYPRTWIAPANEPIDPSKDLNADIDAVRAGRLSPQEFISSWGRDWRKVVKDHDIFWRFCDQAGISFDIDPRKPKLTSAPALYPDIDEKDDEQDPPKPKAEDDDSEGDDK
ncbi:MAG: phage portal protein [Sphingomonadaceae bacterium]|nr:phage portal protein [Sphingomonadaceae bacterium]